MKKKILMGILFVLVLILVLYVALLVINKKEQQPIKEEVNITYNKNESFLQEIDKEGILFKDISCEYDGKNSKLEYTIVNHKNEPVVLNKYKVTIKDRDGRTIIEIEPSLEEQINPGDKYESEGFIDIDLTNAYSMEISLENGE